MQNMIVTLLPSLSNYHAYPVHGSKQIEETVTDSRERFRALPGGRTVWDWTTFTRLHYFSKEVPCQFLESATLCLVTLVEVA